jgi:hypothetical protein
VNTSAATNTKLNWVTPDFVNATNVTAAGAVMKTLLDAKGDMIVASADDTPAKLTVGANHKQPVAASGETTGLKYAYEPVTISIVIPAVTGVAGYVPIGDTPMILTGWQLIADGSGSIVIDVWCKNAAVPTNADTITNGHEPALSSAQYAADTDITDWSDYTLAAKDILAFNVDSTSGVAQVTLTLFGYKTY